MILVLLGTQDKPFTRLLDCIHKAAENGIIKDEIVVQAGCTKYDSKHMKIFDLIPIDEFNDLIKKADLIISHGGVGSILEGLKNDKKIIAAPRLEKYGEHVNDHQLEIINKFSYLGHILPLIDFDDFPKVIEEIKEFSPQKYKSNTENMIRIITDYIDKL